jgi:serine/threonine protein kinase
MVCKNCGAANGEKERFCGQCHAELFLPAEGNVGEVNPSWDLTQISSRNVLPENLINGRYKISKVLGRGGMGDIFLAEDGKLQRKVAIKSINIDLLRDHYAQARFQREAQAASLLDHPNICAIYEIAQENDREYIIMQYVDGVTLWQLQKMKHLSPGNIIDITLQITDGMIAAQEQNIVHLDLKPGNIMIDKSGKVMILDFGLAEFRPRKTANRKNRRPESCLSEKDVVMGTVAYMSPEQIEGQDLDGRSDIFSFGVVLAELLERKNPFSDRDSIVTQYNILHKEIKLSPDIPKALQKIVHKTLQKNRDQRYNDFWEIKNDLTKVRESLVQDIIEQATENAEIKDSRKKVNFARNLKEMVKRSKRPQAAIAMIPAAKSRKLWLALAVLIALAILLALAL